jgi:hypothetical protein
MSEHYCEFDGHADSVEAYAELTEALRGTEKDEEN